MCSSSCVCVCVCVCVRARACVRACVCACVRARGLIQYRLCDMLEKVKNSWSRDERSEAHHSKKKVGNGKDESQWAKKKIPHRYKYDRYILTYNMIDTALPQLFFLLQASLSVPSCSVCGLELLVYEAFKLLVFKLLVYEALSY
jgi:hypothetical protein